MSRGGEHGLNFCSLSWGPQTNLQRGQEVLPGEVQQLAALVPAAHSEHKVVQGAVPQAWLPPHQRLLQEEAGQGCLVVRQPQLPQRLEDAGDAERLLWLCLVGTGGAGGAARAWAVLSQELPLSQPPSHSPKAGVHQQRHSSPQVSPHFYPVLKVPEKMVCGPGSCR